MVSFAVVVLDLDTDKSANQKLTLGSFEVGEVPDELSDEKSFVAQSVEGLEML